MEGFIEFIASNGLCDRRDRILLAVSGGVDSMVMLQLFHNHGYTIGAAHCNFGLRGAEADGDEKLVKNFCTQRSIPFHSKHFDTKYHARKQGLSVQMAARELRYAWFEELAQKEGYHRVATAHHLNDNMETVLLNLVKGTGITGLTGIPVKSKRVIRPLLGFTKTQIREFAMAQDIPWSEDTSNATDDYQRNFLRNQVVPLLKEINPGLEVTFASNIERLSGAKALLDNYLGELCAQFVDEGERTISIDKRIVDTTDHPAYLLWELGKKWGFNYAQTSAIVKSKGEQPGGQFLSSTHRLVSDRAHWLVEPISDPWPDVKLDKPEVSARLGNWNLETKVSYKSTVGTDSSQASLDLDCLKFPITWRRWKPGDAFVPLGMKQKKKLSDFLIDAKVPRTEKDITTVLESNGDIVWVVGHRIDDRYKVTGKTSRVVHFSCSQTFNN